MAAKQQPTSKKRSRVIEEDAMNGKRHSLRLDAAATIRSGARRIRSKPRYRSEHCFKVQPIIVRGFVGTPVFVNEVIQRKRLGLLNPSIFRSCLPVLRINEVVRHMVSHWHANQWLDD